MFLAYGVLKIKEDTSYLRMGVLKLASGSLLWRVVSHPRVVSPLLLQLLLLCLVQFRLKGVVRMEFTYELVFRQSSNRMEQGCLDSF